MSQAVINEILREQTETQVINAESVPCEVPNQAFTHPTSGMWGRMTVLRNDSFQVSVGPPAQHRHPGILVYQLFCPVDEGDGDIMAKGEAIASRFRRITYTKAGVSVVFSTPTVRAVGRDGADEKWYQVNVWCPWYSDQYA